MDEREDFYPTTFTSNLRPRPRVSSMAEESSSTTAMAICWADDEESTPPSSAEAAALEKLKTLQISDDNKDRDAISSERSNITVLSSSSSVYSSSSSSQKFEDLKVHLSAELIHGLYAGMGFIRPSKIQAATIPLILTPPYKDLVAQSYNGSGKTTCFVLGMLSRIDPGRRAPQAICICPTRELALQNHAVLLKISKFMTGVTAMCAVPSSALPPISKRPPVTDQVVIGTPGTIKKLVSAKKLGLRDVKMLVFDEADLMLSEDGFRDDSNRILRDMNKNMNINGCHCQCQVLLFSATFNPSVKAFVGTVIKDGANLIFVDNPEHLTLKRVKQYRVDVPDELAKSELIKRMFELGEKVGQAIVFVRTRDSARWLHSSLKAEGYECTSVQGALDEEARDKIIQEFRDGYTKVLITTDLLARGFDQSQVNLVVNYDLPVKHLSPMDPDYEVYLHRVGRAGRFGRRGAVFNLLAADQEKDVMDKIERHFQHQIAEVANWSSQNDLEASLMDAGLL